MIDAIRENRAVIIPVRLIRPSVELALALYQSAARNCRVNLPVKDDPSIGERTADF